MNLIEKIKLGLLFKFGVYEVRRIDAIEHGDLVIEGVRYSLSPCEWMNYTYLFLFKQKPRIPDDSTESAMQDFINDVESNCFYKEYTRSNMYMIFKRGKASGYVIYEGRMSQQEFHGHFYFGHNIWLDIFSYKFPDPYNLGGIDNLTDAAIHMLASLGERVELDLFRDTEKSDEKNKKSEKIILNKMIRTMNECRSSREGFFHGKYVKGYANPIGAQKKRENFDVAGK